MSGPGIKLAKEMEKALKLKDLFGLACLDDPESSRLLRDLRELIHRTRATMVQSGVVSACTRCATNGKGSCCFREMGESFGSIELFVNLVLGSALPEETAFPESCHFVGDGGCRLQAPQSFCLNYFCPELKETLGEEAICNIQLQVGKQLLVAWKLERALARCIEDAGGLGQIGCPSGGD